MKMKMANVLSVHHALGSLFHALSHHHYESGTLIS